MPDSINKVQSSPYTYYTRQTTMACHAPADKTYVKSAYKQSFSNDTLKLTEGKGTIPPNINIDFGDEDPILLKTTVDTASLDRAIAALEAEPYKMTTINERTMQAMGIGLFDAGLKFLFGVGSTANGKRVSNRTMANALQSSKQSLLAAQGHYDQSELYNKVANKLLESAIQLKPGEQQDKLFNRAETFFNRSEAELKLGDGLVKQAQTMFLKSIGFDDTPQQNPSNKPTSAMSNQDKKIVKWYLTGSSLSLLLLLLVL